MVNSENDYHADQVYDHFKKEMESLGPWEPNPKIAIAFSGGPDSMALLLMAKKWADDQKGTIYAFHVDHLLRSTSTDEALTLQKFCTQEKIPYKILTWHHKNIVSGIQAKARQARYQLLLDACDEKGILQLLTAHHKDDQLETLYMRHQRKSGPTGMQGIRPIIWTPQGRIVRPLLSFHKKDLHNIVQKIPYIQDPSNTNNQYHRVQVRDQIKKGEINPMDLMVKIERSNPQETYPSDFWAYLATIAVFDKNGYVILDFQPDHSYFFQSILQSLQYVSGKPYMPGLSEQQHLEKVLKSPFKSTTLHHCILWKSKNKIFVAQENRNLPNLFLIDPKSYWDNRYLVSHIKPSHVSLGMQLKALGLKGYEQLLHISEKQKNIANVPHRILITMPSFWIQDKLVGFPFWQINLLNEPLPQLNFIPHYDMVRFKTSET